jgi:protein-S-isoprenylcysteine O-methyltransferase Ste14
MSLFWAVRLGLLATLFAIVGLAWLLLSNRQKYEKRLESTRLAILHVTIYNACCYLAVGIPADPAVISAPMLLQDPSVTDMLRVVGIVLLCLGAWLMLTTLLRRRVVGAQDTKQGLITSGAYRFSRHPIYLGIVLASLAIPLLSGNVDGMLVFPLVFLANGCEAIVEERYDVGVRFRAEYQRYRYRTWMFGPPWFWLALGGVLVAVLTVGSMG